LLDAGGESEAQLRLDARQREAGDLRRGGALDAEGAGVGAAAVGLDVDRLATAEIEQA
jgi:hypothetical protein